MHVKVVIFGAIGTAVTVAEQIWDAQNRHGMDIEVLGFAFDAPQYLNRDINGWQVICGTKEAYDKYKDDESVKFVFALHSAKKMEERVNLLHSYGIPSSRFLTFVHPSSLLCKSVMLEEGAIVLANCSISSNTRIGANTLIMSGAYIGHDVCIEECNFIGPRSCIGSFAHLGIGNFTGINSNIRTQKEIGKYNIIGMASNVVKSIGDNNVMVGNPAKALSQN